MYRRLARRLSFRCVPLAAVCIALVALAPVARPALARLPMAHAADGDAIVIHLRFSGGVRYATTLSGPFVQAANQSAAVNECALYHSRTTPNVTFFVNLHWDQIPQYTGQASTGTGFHLVIQGYKPQVTRYISGSDALIFLVAAQHNGLHTYDFGTDAHFVELDPHSVRVAVLHGGSQGSVTATKFSQDKGPATITIHGDWTCPRVYQGKSAA